MQRKRVLRGRETLELGELSLDVLVHLAEIYPEPTSPELLAREVWKQDYVSDDTLAQRVAIIRRALGESAKDPRYIKTIRNKGYVLVEAPEISRPSKRPSLMVVAAAATVFIGVLVIANSGRLLLTAPIQDPEIAIDQMEDLRSLRAREYLNLHQPDETDQAITLLETVLSEEPDNARAQTRLSFALSTRVTKFDGQERDRERAESLARSAIDQDSSNANAWHALGYALDADGRIDEALSAYQLAYQIDQSDAAAMSSAAYLLQIRGRLAESLELEARAWQIRQGSLYAPIQIYNSLRLLNFSASDSWLDTALEVSGPNLVTIISLAENDVYQGQIESAIDRLNEAPDDVRATSRWKLLQARLATSNEDYDRADQLLTGLDGVANFERLALQSLTDQSVDEVAVQNIIEGLIANSDTWPETRVRLAEIFAAQDDLTSANLYMNIAIDLGWRDLDFLEHSPFLKSFRQSQHWPSVVQRIEREIEIQRIQTQSNGTVSEFALVGFN